MFLFYFSIALTVVANIFYHLLQKVIPGGVNPVLSLTATYLTAALASLLLFPLFPTTEGWLTELKRVNWTSYALGISIIGLELGFLLAYRAGWKISLGALISNATVSILLVPLGLFFFREKVSAVNVIGIGVAVAGLVMMNHR